MQSKVFENMPQIKIPGTEQKICDRIRAAQAQFIKGHYKTCLKNLDDVVNGLDKNIKNYADNLKIKHYISQFKRDISTSKKSQESKVELIYKLISNDPNVLESDSENNAGHHHLSILNLALLDLLMKAQDLILDKSYHDASTMLEKIAIVLASMDKINLNKSQKHEITILTSGVADLKQAIDDAQSNPVKEQELMDRIIASTVDLPLDTSTAASACNTDSVTVANKPLTRHASVVTKPITMPVAVVGHLIEKPVSVASHSVVARPVSEASNSVAKPIFIANNPVARAVSVVSKPMERSVSVANNPMSSAVPALSKPVARAASVLEARSAAVVSQLMARSTSVVNELQGSNASTVRQSVASSAAVASESPPAAPVARNSNQQNEQHGADVYVVAAESDQKREFDAQLKEEWMPKSEKLYQQAQDKLITARRLIVLGQFEEATELLHQIQGISFDEIDNLYLSETNLEALGDGLREQKLASFLLESQIPYDPEKLRYDIALEDLEACIPAEPEKQNTINALLRSIVSQVKQLRTTADNSPKTMSKLTVALWSTREFVEGRLALDDYQAVAALMQREPVKRLQNVGAVFMVLAVTALVLSCAVMLLGPALLAIGVYLGSMHASLVIAGAASAALSITGLSFGFFGAKGKKSELGPTMDNLADEKGRRAEFVQTRPILDSEAEPNIGAPFIFKPTASAMHSPHESVLHARCY